MLDKESWKQKAALHSHEASMVQKGEMLETVNVLHLRLIQ